MLPMLPWYPRDFRASTLGWPLSATGCYRALLDVQWDMGSLPAGPSQLRALAGAAPAEWAIAWPFLEPKLPVCEDGRRRNARLEQHRTDALDRKQKAHSKATAAARARWGEGAPADASSNATSNARSMLQAMPGAMLEQCPPSPSPSPSRSPSPPPSQKDLGLTGQPVHARARRSREAAEPPEFAAIRSSYPRRAGSQRWPAALSAYRARLREGHTAAQIAAGVERYAAFIRSQGSEGTAFVQQAATFLGSNNEFLELWALPTSKAQARQDRNVSASEQWLRDQEAKDAQH